MSPVLMWRQRCVCSDGALWTAENSTLYAERPEPGRAAGAGEPAGRLPLPLDPLLLLVLAFAGLTALSMAGLAVYGCCRCRHSRRRAACRRVGTAPPPPLSLFNVTHSRVGRENESLNWKRPDIYFHVMTSCDFSHAKVFQ